MSYARVGENGSDVYVFRTTTENGHHLYVCRYRKYVFECRTPEEMHDHLNVHRLRGHTVPIEALDRLWHEARGLPYETDTQRLLRELRPPG